MGDGDSVEQMSGQVSCMWAMGIGTTGVTEGPAIFPPSISLQEEALDGLILPELGTRQNFQKDVNKSKVELR